MRFLPLTAEFLRERGITVHGQTVKGRGEAFRVAFQKARGDALLFFSPDGNEDALDIPKFRPFLEQGYDMVVGTRMIKMQGVARTALYSTLFTESIIGWNFS